MVDIELEATDEMNKAQRLVIAGAVAPSLRSASEKASGSSLDSSPKAKWRARSRLPPARQAIVRSEMQDRAFGNKLGGARVVSSRPLAQKDR